MKTFYKYDDTIWPDFGEKSYEIRTPLLGDEEAPKENGQRICLWDEEKHGTDYHWYFVCGEARSGERLYDGRDYLYKIDEAVGEEKEILLALTDDIFSEQLLEYFLKLKEKRAFRLHVFKKVHIPVREEKERFLLKYTDAIEEMDSVAFFNRAAIMQMGEADFSDVSAAIENQKICSELLCEEVENALLQIENLTPVSQEELWLYDTKKHAYEKITICEADLEKVDVREKSVYEEIAPTDGREMCKKLKKYRLQFKEKYDIKTKEYSCVYQGPCRGTCRQCEAYAAEVYRKVYAETDLEGRNRAESGVYAQINGVIRLREDIDGPGIRSLIVMNDCHLRCKFCLNKEYINVLPMNSAMSQYELTELVKKDMVYFEMSGGGVTFGGGEPLLSAGFIKAFKQANPNLHVAVETSLNVPYEEFEQVLDCVDLWIVDVKDMNKDIYHAYTGKSNANVIYNLTDLVKRVLPENIVCRLPLIKGFNTESDVEKSLIQLKEIGVTNIEKCVYRC